MSSATRYSPPIVESVAVTTPLATAGQQLIIIHGANFGPAVAFNHVAFNFKTRNGGRFVFAHDVIAGFSLETMPLTSKCNVTITDRTMACFTPGGVGTNFVVSVFVGGQESEALLSTTLSYAKPVAASVLTSGIAVSTLVFRTNGLNLQGAREQVTITGVNFGPATPANTPTVKMLNLKLGKGIVCSFRLTFL